MQKDKSIWYIAVGIVVMALIIHMASLQYARSAYSNALAPIGGADTIANSILNGYSGTVQTELIKKQYGIYAARKAHYNTLMKMYYSHYYALNILLIVFSTLSTILIFITAKSGWDNRSIHQRITLLTVIMVASVAYLMQNVTNNQVNIKHNLNGYIFTTKQQLLILKNLNQCNLGPNYVCTKMDTIVAGTYDSLVNNLQYFFDMDGSKISRDPLNSITGN